MPRTKRFEFSEGDYWEIYGEKTWGAQCAVERLTRGFIKLDGASVDAATGEITGEIMLDPEKWDPNAANETLLLHSTVAWSYGPITAEVMAHIPVRYVEEVLNYLNGVYPTQDPLAVAKLASELERPSPSPSSAPTSISPRRWWMPTTFSRRDGRPKSSMPSR